MITFETALYHGTIAAAGGAGISHVLGMPDTVTLFVIAMAGSLASVGFRWLGGHLKDWKQRCMAFITGMLLAVIAVPYLATKGLEGLSSGIFVFAIALIGARVVKFLSTDFDVASFVDGIIKRIRG